MTLASVGPAVRTASHDVRKQLLNLASQVLEVPSESLSIRDSMLHSRAFTEPVPVKEVLSALGDYMIIGLGSRGPNPERVNVNTFGAQFAEVEVNIETGEVKVEKFIAVHDSGRVVNPMTFSSQIEGGVLQGIGFGLMEKHIVDQATGLVMNGDLENYKIPTLLDVPEILVEMIDTPDPLANSCQERDWENHRSFQPHQRLEMPSQTRSAIESKSSRSQGIKSYLYSGRFRDARF